MVIQRWPNLCTSVGPTLKTDHIIRRWANHWFQWWVNVGPTSNPANDDIGEPTSDQSPAKMTSCQQLIPTLDQRMTEVGSTLVHKKCAIWERGQAVGQRCIQLTKHVVILLSLCRLIAKNVSKITVWILWWTIKLLFYTVQNKQPS